MKAWQCIPIWQDTVYWFLSLLSGLLVATKTPETDSLVIYYAPKSERNNENDFFRAITSYFSYRLELFDAIEGVAFTIEGLETATKGFGDEATQIGCITVRPDDPFAWAVKPCCNINDQFHQKLDKDDKGMGPDSGGGGGGSGSPGSLVPVVDPKLTEEQKKIVLQTLEDLKKECLSKWILSTIGRVSITIDPTINAKGKYSPSTNKITLKDVYDGDMEEALLHELVHAMQDNAYPGGIGQYGKDVNGNNKPGHVNIEFEASLMVNLIQGYNGFPNRYPTVQGSNRKQFGDDLASMTNDFKDGISNFNIDNLKNTYMPHFKQSYPQYKSAEASSLNNNAMKNAVAKSNCYN